MKKSFKNLIKNIEVSQTQNHKDKLKQSLMSKATHLYNERKENEEIQKTNSFPWAKTLKFSFAALGVIAVVFIIKSSPSGNSTNQQQPLIAHNSQENTNFFDFIQKAKAYTDENMNKIHYTKIKTEEVDPTTNKATLRSQAEIWDDNKGNKLIKSDYLEGQYQTPSSSIDIDKVDAEGNLFSYTKHTKGRSVAPGKILNYENELNKINNDVFCLNTEEDATSIGISIFQIHNDNFSNVDISAMTRNKDDKSFVIDKLFRSASGNLSKADLLNIIDKYKDSGLIQYKQITENGLMEYAVSLKGNDFNEITGTSPELVSEGLKHNDIYTFYLNSETYALVRLEVISTYNDTPIAKEVTSFPEDKYLDNIDEAQLFNVDDFDLVWVSSVMERKLQGDMLYLQTDPLQNGCYQKGTHMDEEKSQSYIDRYQKQAGTQSQTLWKYPLTWDKKTTLKKP